MKIRVDRFISDNDSTVSRISIDGVFECFGLEDEYQVDKVPKETRIPPGTYRVGLRKVGGFHGKYKRIFAEFHQGMLHIKKVPSFKYILIHCGNTDDDTAGCLLVGSSAHTEAGDMSVASSRAAYRRFYPKVIEAAKSGDLEITFEDNDR